MVRTVSTSVDTVVGQIERRKHDDTVSVEIFFDLFCKCINFFIFLFDITVKKNGSFPVGESFSFFGFCNDLVDQFHVMFVCLCIGEGFQNFLVVDKFLWIF